VVSQIRGVIRIIPFLLISIWASAQNVQQRPLTQIINELEERFDIIFTYLDSNLEGITIESPSKSYDLNGTLEFLRTKTQLQFKQLDSRFIAISIPTQRNQNKRNQNICGLIKDENSKEPLSDAFVISGGLVTISNQEGFFEFDDLSTNDSITIRLLGYAIKTFVLSDLPEDSCQHFYLKQKTTSLEQIIVTDYITKGINKRVDGSLVINTGIVGILPGLTEPDVLHSLQTLPGIQSINETVSDINVRGGTNDQNLILWDGIRMYQSGHFFGLISAFNPYITDKVVFTKNGTNAGLGRGVSSTIDIRTDNRVTESFTGTGGFNLINGDLLFKIPLSKKMSLHLSGRRSFADVIQTPTFDQYFERVFRDTEVLSSSSTLDGIEVKDNFYFIDGSMKFLYDITSRDKLRISFLDIRNEIQYQENELLNGLVESRTSGLVQKSLATGVDYSRLWSDRVKTSLLFNLSSYRLNSVNFDILNEQRLIQENEILDVGFKLDSRISLNNNFGIYTGYQFGNLGITNLEDLNNPNFRRLIREVLTSHTFFAESTFNSNSEKTTARVGVRSTYFEKFNKVIVEPRFALAHRLSNRFSLELLGEMKNQYTTQIIDFQTDFLGIEKRRWVLSNDNDIPILRSNQISLGISYNYNELLITLEGYLKSVDEITSSSQGFQNQFQFVRTSGNYDAVGLDFLLNKKFQNVSTWLSYAIANNTFEFNGLIPPTFPNNLDIAHTMTVGASYELKAFEFSSGLNFRTGKPFTKPDQDIQIADREINYDLPNSARIDSYVRVDLSVKYNFKLSDKTTAQFGASVWNVMNKENIVNVYYQLDPLGQVEEIQQRSLGITPNLNFRINF